MPRVRAKRWCLTLNNPTEEEKDLKDLYLKKTKESEPCGAKSITLTYLVIGMEMGSTNTPHYQAYLEVNKKVSFSTVKTLFPRGHWEQAKGTSMQASDYCKKDGTFEEEGTLLPGQGSRSDLQNIKNLIENGAKESFIAEQYFEKWVVYRRSFQAYATLMALKRSWETQVHVYWGKTGTGKTRFCMDQVMDSEMWSPGDYKWFDGYAGQRIVIFDDYRGEYKLQMLLKLLDRYPMQVPVKGGFVEWCPTKIYITSNIHPNDWYPMADRYSVSAMFRRFNNVESVFESLY